MTFREPAPTGRRPTLLARAGLAFGFALAAIVPAVADADSTDREHAEARADDPEASAPAAPPAGPGETIVVTATRLPLAPEDTGRSVATIERPAIERHAAQAIPEILDLLPFLDVRRRGPFGVQADLSARGASFEETLVLIDGVPFTNAQTGHHNLDLPLPAGAIDRIEVVHGPGSALYGANATGAVVQILTRDPAPGLAASAEVFAGQHSLAGARAALDLGFRGAGGGGHRVALERNESSGHRRGTAFDQGAITWSARHGDLRLRAGANERDFGALRFYSTRFPDQQERTAGAFGSARWHRGLAGGEIFGLAAWRRHRDHFILDRARPSFSENFHRDDSFDLEASWRGGRPWGDVEIGGGARRERLDSSNLGERERDRGAAFAAFARRQGRLGWRAAVHVDRVEAGTSWDTQVHPGLAVALATGPSSRLRLASASAYRLPSFTELHYRDPASAGNPALVAERSWTHEAGWEWTAPAGGRSVALTAFERRGRDLIDFVQAPGDLLFRAVNLRRVTTQGVEFLARQRLRSGDAVLSYTGLDARGDAPRGVSRYVFDHLRHRAALRLTWDGPHGATLGVHGSWNERRGGDPYLRLDARLAAPIGRGGRPRAMAVYLEGTNLNDARAIEQGSVELPGRWLLAGLRWSLQ